MTPEQTKRYHNLYTALGLDPKDFDDLDLPGKQALLKAHIEAEFCKDLFGEECASKCNTGCDSC